MKKQAYNPYLPSWEYIPDGEPHVFGDRVYIYGSHDQFNGWVFCPGDYVCYSASVDDLKDWRFEGVTYRKTQDPLNEDGHMCLYAPDVTVGPDGRYYLYYCLDKVPVVSVAVSDRPAGPFEFYGYVQYEDGTRVGEREGDMPQFDPAVITEGDVTYLYTGFCGNGMKDRKGAMSMELGKDMLTVKGGYNVIVPGNVYGAGSGFEGHEFFEASSIRKIGDVYYFVYSSVVMHELCYATSRSPREGFTYGGVIVSNCDMHISSYKPADMPAAYGANNHGGMVQIKGEWYIFYHRQTNGSWYSRQGCAEKICILEDGSIPQVEITSCGLNGGPLEGKGTYPGYIACNIFVEKDPCPYIAGDKYPYITQEGRDGDENEGFVANLYDGATFGFKYFDFKDVKKVSLTTRCYISGVFEVRTEIGGPVLGTIPCEFSNVWVKNTADVALPDGVHALFFTFRGSGNGQVQSFTLE